MTANNATIAIFLPMSISVGVSSATPLARASRDKAAAELAPSPLPR